MEIPKYPGGGARVRHLLDRRGILVRPVRDQAEAQEVARILAEQIAHPTDRPFPQAVGQDDGTLRPTLIGAWAEHRLVGGAFIGPDEIAAQDFARFEGHHAAQVVRAHMAMVEGIAVIPERRREGIGLQIKLACDAWAAQHHAAVVTSIPTTEAARRLNEEAGHTILPPHVRRVVQITDGQDTPLTRAVSMGRAPGVPALWAFRIVAQTTGTAIRIGQHRPVAPVEGTRHDGYAGIHWLATTNRRQP